jgi:hypothetical protein
VGGLGDQHLARVRERRQPCRYVDGVAERREVGDRGVGADGGDVRDPRVDAGAERADESVQRADDLVPVLYVLIDDFPHPRNP